MELKDISKDIETTYRLGENERVAFLMENRDGEIIFELTGTNAVARIFALYDGTEDDRFTPRIIQRHFAPDTVSTLTVRARLDGSSSLRFRGLVEIDRGATRSDARQDIRALLLSPEASASAMPELEIDTNDVSCSHAASIAPPDAEQLAYLATRGLSKAQATRLLTDGFFHDTLADMRRLADNVQHV